MCCGVLSCEAMPQFTQQILALLEWKKAGAYPLKIKLQESRRSIEIECCLNYVDLSALEQWFLRHALFF